MKGKSCLSTPCYLLLCAAVTFCGSFPVLWLDGAWTEAMADVGLFHGPAWFGLRFALCDPWSCCVHLGHQIAHKHRVKEFDSAYSNPTQISWHNLLMNDRKGLAKCVHICKKEIFRNLASGRYLELTKLHRNLHGIKSFWCFSCQC